MYTKIMVAIDGSATARRALDLALAMAHDHHADLLPVYVVSAPLMSYDLPLYDPEAMRGAMFEEGRAVNREAAALMTAARVAGTPSVVETEIGEDVAQRIVSTADAWGAQLLVLGTHGRRGFRRLMLGSVAERVVRLSALPVLLVPAAQPSAAAQAEPAPAGSAAAVPAGH
jgi:nucleotide-binding universal stress UspA family protein